MFIQVFVKFILLVMGSNRMFESFESFFQNYHIRKFPRHLHSLDLIFRSHEINKQAQNCENSTHHSMSAITSIQAQHLP